MTPRRYALALALATSLASSPEAGAATTWVVRGAGFGHGVGLSAYGAYGYGRHGSSYRQILHHYFARIQLTRLHGSRRVRVLLSIDPSDVRFAGATAACGLRLRPSRSYIAHRVGSSVRLVSTSGRRLAGCGTRLHADSRGTVQIRGLGRYRGALEVVPTASAASSLNVINDVNVEDYVRGSVPAEVYSTWPMATLEAMAVAARSIGLSVHVGGHGFDLYADTRTQLYHGIRAETARATRAVRATRHIVSTYRGTIIQAVYSSSSGGRTESRFLGAPRVPYLKSVLDPYDVYAPLHRWTLRFSQAQMDARLGPYVRGSLRRIVVTARGDSPRIRSARLVGTGGTTTVRGDTLQYALGLYSSWAYFRRQRGR